MSLVFNAGTRIWDEGRKDRVTLWGNSSAGGDKSSIGCGLVDMVVMEAHLVMSWGMIRVEQLMRRGRRKVTEVSVSDHWTSESRWWVGYIPSLRRDVVKLWNWRNLRRTA